MRVRPSLAALALLASLVPAPAAPYGPDGLPVQFTQPDGTVLNLRVFGDEFYARTVAENGQTVIYDETTQAYHYADPSPDGQRLVPGPRIRRGALSLRPRGLDLPPAERGAIAEARRARFDAGRAARWERRLDGVALRERARRRLRDRAALGAPSPAQSGPLQAQAPVEDAAAEAIAPAAAGNQVGLMILAQFPDDPNTATVDPIHFPATQAAMESYSNQLNYTVNGNTGSVRDYFRAQSGNRLDYTQLVSPVVTLPQPRSYYNYSDYPANTVLRDSGAAGRLVVGDAINALKALGFNFSTLTRDSGNRVLATNVLFAGNNSGVWSRGLWPHSWAMNPRPNVGTATHPVFISDYQITNLANAAPVIGTYVHENGHMILDLPDLYDYDGDSEGVGNHCLMGAGNHNNGGRTPAPINAHFKQVCGWLTYTDLAAGQFVESAILPSTGNVAWRYRKPGSGSEFFVIENRGAGDPYAAHCPDQGIAIWHIDSAKNGNNEQQMTASQHYEVSLEQADGAFDLENNRDRGDSTDLFDNTRPLFADATSPDAHWWDGGDSGLRVQVKSPPGADMTVTFGLGGLQLLSQPGSSLLRGSPFAILWSAAGNQPLSIELLRSGQPVATLASSTPNDGRFDWSVPADFPTGADYQLRLRLQSNPVQEVLSKAFAIGDEVFPPRGQFPAGYTSSGPAWTVDGASSTSEGAYSMRSAAIGHGATSAIEFAGSFQAGQVRFAARVSSEAGYDFLHFSIDGVTQDLLPGSAATGLSGEVGWTGFTFPISAGSHTLRWDYTKDGNVVRGSDAAWLDAVMLPLASPFQQWQQARFGIAAANPTVAGLNADPDGDGLDNLAEYAAGSDPNRPTSTPPLRLTRDAAGRLSLEFERNPAATDVTRHWWWSPDLRTWTELTLPEAGLGTQDGVDRLRASLPAARTEGFFRAEYRLNAP